MSSQLPTSSNVGSRISARRRFLKQAGATTAVVAVASLAPRTLGHADRLDDDKARLDREIKASNAKLASCVGIANQATAKVQTYREQLSAAKTKLANLQSQVAQAQLEDARITQQLADANAKLHANRQATLLNEQVLKRQQRLAAQNLRLSMQQESGLVGAALLIDPSNSTDLAHRSQWSSQVFNSTQHQQDALAKLQQQLQENTKNSNSLVATVADLKTQSSNNLSYLNSLHQQVAEQENNLSGLLDQSVEVKKLADQAVADEKALNAKIRMEADSVNARIQERIRRQKEEERRREEARRREEERRRRQGGKRKNNSGHASTSTRIHRFGHTGSAEFNTSKGLIMPIHGPITSPFGMRLHPVLRIWRLHDGTDIAGGCGTPIKAAADGVVTERYFNVGYGHRLFIDHGKVNGKYVTTSYNHAIKYIVSPGEKVTQGQVVGYVGTTGWSTGCHLHFMIWENGKLINPMTWFK